MSDLQGQGDIWHQQLALQDSSRAGLPPVDYNRDNFPGSIKALSQVLVIPWNEFYTDEHVEYIADRLHASVGAEVGA